MAPHKVTTTRQSLGRRAALPERLLPSQLIHNMQNRGFTLIETIIYIAILALLIGGGIAAAFYVIDSSSKTKSEVNIQAEGISIIRKIEWALTGASNANLISATDISITKDTGAGFPAAQNPLNFSLQGSSIQLTTGSPIV